MEKLISKFNFWKLEEEKEYSKVKLAIPNLLKDWEDVTIKYCIHCHSNEVQPTCVVSNSKPLSFPTKEARDAFLEVFKDLLEEAKMFI